VTFVLGAVLGVFSGVRHAFEPDHLAAVSTMVAGQRSPRASARFAAFWGIGHAAMLVLVAGVLMALERSMPERVANALELVVAVMLVVLGLDALRRAAKAMKRGPAFEHAHGAAAHAHPGTLAHVHVKGFSFALRPLAVGTLHGLAGSGALTALVAASSRSTSAGLVFIALYGLGATLGMAAVAGLAGVPLARLGRSRVGSAALLGVAGGISVVVGIVWAVPFLRG